MSRIGVHRPGSESDCWGSNVARLKDLTGCVFTRLTVIERAPDRVAASGRRKVMWCCRCACGKVTDVARDALTSGRQVSCGCWRDEQRHQQVNDLTGQTFGRLFVLCRGETVDGRVSWYCRCECGGELLVRASNLTSGNSESCGCRRRLPGEDNPNWKGSIIGYDSMHARLRRWLGDAPDHPCEEACGRQATTWSYDHEDPFEHVQEVRVRRRDGWRYLWMPFSLDPSHYQPRCWPCHNELDHPRTAA